jgi:hypothetical protein
MRCARRANGLKTGIKRLSNRTLEALERCAAEPRRAPKWVILPVNVGYSGLRLTVYGIPKVKRSDYIRLDRRHLAYLNWAEKFNCEYCGYANGVLACATEIAARTEQYWCPIKHALRMKSMHSRYRHFFEYGDAEHYRQHIEEVRRSFEDVAKSDKEEAAAAASA